MTAGFPVKADYVAGDILTAQNMDDLAGTVNLLNPTAKGGLVSASAANTPSTLTVGANNTILVADSAATPGIKWTSTLTSPTIDVINAASASGTTQSLFPNTTTGTVNVATGLTSGSLNLGNSLIVSGATTQTIATAATTAASTNSNGITIKTGSAIGAGASAGSITIDVGPSALVAGTINIGTSTSSGMKMGRTFTLTQTDGYRIFLQQTPNAQTASVTLTLANLLTEIITSTSASAVALTLPTGTASQTAPFLTVAISNQAFDWTIINLGSSFGAVTLTANTGYTIVGSATVAIGTSARWRSVNTATNTWVAYRIS